MEPIRRARALTIALSLVGLVLPATAEARDEAARGGLRVGMQYATGLDHDSLDDFLYPSFG